MPDHDLDRILSTDDSIVPSSGFVTSVMDAVRREASTLPPIPFPWKRALPGLTAAVLALVAIVAGVYGVLTGQLASAPLPDNWSTAAALCLNAWRRTDAGWILVALLITLVSVQLSLHLASRRS